jgi:phosphoglycolate phosphatase-like HAD superfamily hydrolase
MSAIRGLIWDVDGTLSNTLEACVMGLQVAIASHGGPTLAHDEIVAMFGPTEEGILMKVLGDVGDVAIETYLEEYARHHDDAHLDFPEVTAIVQRLALTPLPMGVVTGKGRRSAEITLERIGFVGTFDPVATGSDTGSVKSIEISRIVAGWGLDPGEVAYIGDAPTDVVEARAAGVVPVSAAWHATADAERLAALGPAVVATDARQLDLWLAEHLDGAYC